MASQTAKGSGSTNNNGGTVINGGSISADGPISKNLPVKDQSVGGPYGSQILESNPGSGQYSDTDGLTVASSGTAGGLAYTPDVRAGERNFILKGAGTASAGKINNTASTLLNGTGSEFAGVQRSKKNVVAGARKLGKPTWTYPVLPDSGRHPGLTNTADLGDDFSFTSTTDGTSAGTDKATSRTRSVPGEVTYRTGAPTATTSNLVARDSAEQ